MKKLVSLILVFIILLPCAFAVNADGTERAQLKPFPFGDVPATRWSNPYIVLLYNEGIVGGMTTYTFQPADSVTRAQFVKMLAGIAQADTAGCGHSFTDVKKDSWYEPYVAWAAENGVVNGTAPGIFSPDGLITRQDMATMIYRYIESLEKESGTPNKPILPVLPVDPPKPPVDPPIVLPVEPKTTPEIMSEGQGVTEEKVVEREINADAFSDMSEVAEYAKQAVLAMKKMGIIGGLPNEDGTFRFEPRSNATREQAAKMLCTLYLLMNEDKTLPGATQALTFIVNYNTAIGKPISGHKWVLAYNPGVSFKLPEIAANGYTFLGWSGPGIEGRALSPVIKAGSVSGNVTYTAHWLLGGVEIVYDLNGGVYPEIYN